MQFPQRTVHFAINPKLSIPNGELLIRFETSDSELERELKPLCTCVVWGVWVVCETAISDARLAFWSHCGTWYVLMTFGVVVSSKPCL